MTTDADLMPDVVDLEAPELRRLIAHASGILAWRTSNSEAVRDLGNISRALEVKPS